MVQRSLKSLAKHSPLERSEIRRFEQLAAEACAAANSFLLEQCEHFTSDATGCRFIRGSLHKRAGFSMEV